jgi:ABC-2 type transport system ATP-binding protein
MAYSARAVMVRLGFAQVQANYPDLLILDEPAASLNPLERRDALDVMSKLRKNATIFLHKLYPG